MSEIQYVVTATIALLERDRYVVWLTDRHVEMVMATGLPRSARVVVLDGEEGGEATVRTEYVFASRRDYEAYVAEHAPLLRGEGTALFPDARFSRMVGAVAGQWSA